MNPNSVNNILKQALTSDEMPSASLIRQVKQESKHTQTRRKKKDHGSVSFRHFVSAAAVLLVIIGSTVLSGNLFGARDALFSSPNDPSPSLTAHAPTNERIAPVSFSLHDLLLPNYHDEMDVLSLQGPVGRPEHSALARWKYFESHYDQDQALLIAADEDYKAYHHHGTSDERDPLFDVPSEYSSLGIYTMEMVEEIRTILDEYNLTLLGNMLPLHTAEELSRNISYGPIFTDDSVFFNGWQFESGTFHIEGTYNRSFMFSLRASRKGVFDTTYLTQHDITAFEEWHFENIHGTHLLLAQSPDISLIIAETETTFFFVHIGAGSSANAWLPDQPHFTAEDLEAFANLIDFRQIRSEIPDFQEEFETERNERIASISSLVGEWSHLHTISNENLLTSYANRGIEIRADRSMQYWYGVPESGFTEENLASGGVPFGSFFINGELNHHSGNEFEIEIIGMMAYNGAPDIDVILPYMSLHYNPATGLLRHTDWEGNRHFFERSSPENAQELKHQMAGNWIWHESNPNNALIVHLSPDGTWESPGPLPIDMTIGGNFIVAGTLSEGIYRLHLTVEHASDHPGSAYVEFGSILEYKYDSLHDRLGMTMPADERGTPFDVWFERQ